MRIVKLALRYEVRLWIALFRWVFRRPVPVPPGTRHFPYAGAVMMILWAFIGVSAIETPILHLLLPWQPVRLTALVLSVYGLFWMIGVLSFGMAGGTTVDIVLSRPLTLPVKQTRGEPVSEIRFHADTPDDLVTAAHAFLGAPVD